MVRSRFFNSVNGDRIYQASDWAAYFASFIGNGVFAEPGTSLQVVAGSNMTVVVRSGKGWINGYFAENDGDLILQLANADGVLKRIDRIVLRWNSLAREMQIVAKSSAPSQSPVAPALQRDADLWELCLADVRVNNGVTQITQANITDQRWKKDLCGPVIGVIEQVDPSFIIAQFEDFFHNYEGLVTARFDLFNNVMEGNEDAARQSYEEYVAQLRRFEDWFTSQSQQWFGSFSTDFENRVNAWLEDFIDTLGDDQAIGLFNKIDRHERLNISASADGVHGIRYKDGNLQVFDGQGWVTMASVIVGYRWRYADTLNQTFEELDTPNITWYEIDNLIEREAS